jgi:DNA-binding response OmpR family regulator
MMEQLETMSLEYDSTFHTARILVVEDNCSDVFLLDRALKRQNLQFELKHMADGGEALAFLRREGVWEEAATPDLILIDLNLTRYAGEEIVREIRAAKHLAHVPICVWSSSQSRRDQSMLRELGVARFVAKPTGLDQFLEIGEIIKELLASPGMKSET